VEDLSGDGVCSSLDVPSLLWFNDLLSYRGSFKI
jgi:hypothetical protein